jgi:hypothetical protein
MNVIKNFFKKDIVSVIFIQAGISILKSIYYSVSHSIYFYMKNSSSLDYKKFIELSKVGVYRDTIQTNIMGITSLIGAFSGQFNVEKK